MEGAVQWSTTGLEPLGVVNSAGGRVVHLPPIVEWQSGNAAVSKTVHPPGCVSSILTSTAVL